MKKTLLAAFVAAMFMTPFAFADGTATQSGSDGNAGASTARTEGTSPPARTFAYLSEVKALIAEGAEGSITLEATCGVELHQDGTFTDVTHPERPVAYGTDGTEINEASYPDLAAAPDSVKRKIALLAAAIPDNDETSG